MTEAIGLYLLWGGIVFAVTPFVVAVVFQTILESKKYNEKKTGFKVAIGVYAAAIFKLIGIPGLYLGVLFNAIKTKTFSDAYWAVIVGWYRFFNFYHEFKGTKAELKEGQEFLNQFGFQLVTWQICLALVIAPLMFWWILKQDVPLSSRQQKQSAKKFADHLNT